MDARQIAANWKRQLPTMGIVAFSLCSTHSIYQLLVGSAKHPTLLLWLPSVLVELVTAWVVGQVVEQGRQVSRSNISKQDRHFYGGILLAFVAVAIPLLAVSVWANVVEFGSVALGLVFPVSSIGCAVGAALPETVAKHRQIQAEKRRERARERREKAEERQRQAEQRRAEAEREQRQRQTLANLGKSAPIYELYSANPMTTQAEAAHILGTSRQTIGYHLDKLESDGLIKRNGQGVEVIV